MLNKRAIGKKYEELAKKYLISNNYKIITTNFFTKIGEIDIIAKDKNVLCFVEVKYRAKDSLVSGLYAVDKVKQKRIYNAAKYYMLTNNIKDDTMCRFDVISIDGDDIMHIKNAFP